MKYRLKLKSLKTIDSINGLILRYEPILFLLLLIISVIPIFQQTYILTLDGPAHCYNAQIVNSLLFEKDSFYANFIQFNPEIVPNWSGHAILALLNSFFSMTVSEKILQTSLVFFLPIVFRRLVKTIAPQNVFMSYLVFPFSFSFVFFLGFYNFSIALIFLFVFLNYLVKNFNEIGKFKTTFILFSLALVTYFSHALVFIFVVTLYAIYVLFKLSEKLKQQRIGFREIIKLTGKKFLWFVLIMGIPLFLFISFQLKRIGNPNNQYLSVQELLTWIVEFRHLIAYNYTLEKTYTSILAMIIGSLTCLFLVVYFYRIIKTKSRLKIDYWFLIFLIFFALLFIFPDSNSTGGVISIRMVMVVLLFLILALSRIRIAPIIIFPIVVFYFIVSFQLNNGRKTVWKDLNHLVFSMNNVATKIKENSSVAYFNFSGNWLLKHYSNYIGYDKNLLILENYEIDQSCFPLHVIENRFPNFRIGDLQTKPYDFQQNWISGNNKLKNVDYVILQGNLNDQTDSTRLTIIGAIKNNYKLIHHGDGISLFELVRK